MANNEHLRALRSGADEWRLWRVLAKMRGFKPDFRLAGFENENFSGANLQDADFAFATLLNVDLSRVDLTNAILSNATLWNVNLTKAKLERAELLGTKLVDTDLSEAEIIDSRLALSTLIRVNVDRAKLINCTVYGISIWDLKGKPSDQSHLIINPMPLPSTTDPMPLPSTIDRNIITVDSIQMAQFIYLMLYNEKVKDVVDTVTAKVVLILGRFTPERKDVLNVLREELKKRDYVPVLFDFEKPDRQDLLGTVEFLARMARFVIADITEASSVPAELQAIVPHLRTVPVRPLLRAGSPEYALFAPLKSYPWVLEEIEYRDIADVRASLDRIIVPAEAKARELRPAM